ncbi:YciI family protein [Dyella jiangningensis]|uniref:YCII-related domain-containing protein n=1 Tax=Dyella jiangningensis TaxID=1379159 RepID=A0A328P349_9GAMM|nr:YciI family protein [Dyella jiangningensis]RAO75366.1 hypothetical protein CA260_14875 [Dyella jiangningensis]
MNRYLVMAMRRANFDPAMVQPHLDFLQGLRTGGVLELSGGFSDKSGGAYLMRAQSMDEALSIAHQDPAYTSGGWEITVYEWQAR